MIAVRRNSDWQWRAALAIAAGSLAYGIITVVVMDNIWQHQPSTWDAVPVFAQMLLVVALLVMFLTAILVLFSTEWWSQEWLEQHGGWRVAMGLAVACALSALSTSVIMHLYMA